MDKIISGFIDYLNFEKGLSANTLAAYRRDLEKFGRYLQANDESISLHEVEKKDVMAFLSWQLDQQASYATAARSLSSLKTFYKYLLMENQISSNPTQDLETPKVKRKLPMVLSIEEIDRLMQQPMWFCLWVYGIGPCWN
ncbi:site-specific integrase [Syntrophomonas palmitatica]|uniref:site-specific integrase n=1 Tax=Syntrophomonas palmitatica TaxID=402877 RepID=UPI000B0A7AF5